ncbi:mannosylglycerate hydrolase [Halolactibacillus halophilus]|uniref:Alpha-mannosidase n=1 Tax=Halolactibacillus halophilus TaxID=306540 RepID=A0A1I5Q6U1_9BACI|nr:glycosyl hydrolase-related protein [Halolactibacillus halophilus]GEM01620.1 alpha-mannosidase [Halolactibacillus halophilus]SFP41740.1 mannosylglycerate hydrolase [Halolactibacillus halophilus]
MSRDIKILMHTHWDREWYFTKDETKVLLRNHMQDVMDYLEDNPETIYILDGQSVMIDDYLELEPTEEPRLKRLIQSGNLRVGPWYTQTDLLLVHGESIFRNLYYGIKRAREFGEPMLVGYAPDTFGHASQMPQIYQQFGIESTFFWRGFSELKAEKSDFLWEGVDGTRIFGINLATGYQGAKYLESDPKLLSERMAKLMHVLDTYSASNSRLIMNGHDQMPLQRDIKQVMTEIEKLYPEDNVSLTDFEGYLQGLNKDELEIVRGELTDSKHARIHRTIGSTRMDIKLLNNEIETKLYHTLEPLAVIGERVGIPYPHGVVERIAKLLFGAHAHDSIGGCNSDSVNQDIKQRLINAKEMVDTQIELHLRLLTMANKATNNTIVIVNPSPEKRAGEMVSLELITRTKNFDLYDESGQQVDYVLDHQQSEDAGLIDRQVAARLKDITVYRTNIYVKVDEMRGLSARYFTYEEVETKRAEVKQTKNAMIKNDFGQLFIEDNQLHYRHKKTNRVYHNVLSIENSGDAGDSYDYSPPVTDWVLNTQAEADLSFTIEKTALSEVIKLTLAFSVPSNQTERENKQTTARVEFTGTCRLFENDPKVYVELNHTNTTADSRYRLVFRTGIITDEVKVDGYLSDQLKPVYLSEPLAIWEQDNWVEKPVSIETMQSYLSLKRDHQFNLYTKGLKEYEVVDGNAYVTLFRTFSHLGKRNLINRPGRPSGIEIKTPDNQLKDTSFTFNCAFDFEQIETQNKQANRYLTPLIGYQRKEFNRFNLNPRPKVKLDDTDVTLNLGQCVVSAVKCTEDNQLLIRLYNPMDQPDTLTLPEGSKRANAMEEPLQDVKEVTVKPQEIMQFIIHQ